MTIRIGNVEGYVGADNNFISNVNTFSTGLSFITSLQPKSFNLSNAAVANAFIRSQVFNFVGPDVLTGNVTIGSDGNTYYNNTISQYYGFTTNDIVAGVGQQFVTEGPGINNVNYKFNRTFRIAMVNSIKELNIQSQSKICQSNLSANQSITAAATPVVFNTSGSPQHSDYSIAAGGQITVNTTANVAIDYNFTINTGGQQGAYILLTPQIDTGGGFADINRKIIIPTLGATPTYLSGSGSFVASFTSGNKFQISVEYRDGAPGMSIIDGLEGNTWIKLQTI